jgi:colanic acid/amylovoran biosynthesis glycosyltransferase
VTIAYLANLFPSAVEPYVSDEIEELRRRGIRIVTGSVRKASGNGQQPEVCLQPLRMIVLLRAAWLCATHWREISDLVWRVVAGGREGLTPRVKALLHTWLGACYALMLADLEIDHLHVHHGYFGSWLAMVAARFLHVGFSVTLHGSDLLLRGAYLDVKLKHCSFCLTVSEFNRRYILEHYPEAQPAKIVVSRLGVEMHEQRATALASETRPEFNLLAVGRLHEVKDHAFLLRACAELAERGLQFECAIAGDGPERRRLESLIKQLGLENRVTLLGHVPRRQMDSLYRRADLVVLTSRSEGLPLVLMEAMARGKVVLAPAITGIPELVIPEKSGFLYEPGSLEDLVNRLIWIHDLAQVSGRAEAASGLSSARRPLDWVRHAARVQVQRNFNRSKNLKSFGDVFMQRILSQTESALHEDFVLQQIQLPVQRHRSLPV